jgi:hypothetical protein
MTEYNVVDRYQSFGGTTAFTFRIEVCSQDGNAGTHLLGYTNLEHYNIQTGITIGFTHSLKRLRQIRRLV